MLAYSIARLDLSVTLKLMHERGLKISNKSIHTSQCDFRHKILTDMLMVRYRISLTLNNLLFLPLQKKETQRN